MDSIEYKRLYDLLVEKEYKQVDCEIKRMIPNELSFGEWYDKCLRRVCKHSGAISKNYVFEHAFLKGNNCKQYYKYFNGKKHTTDRNLILQILIASRFNFDDINNGLELYGMNQLNQASERDLVIIVGVTFLELNNDRLPQINEWLYELGMDTIFSMEV